jgi:hypothetical protein
MKHWNYITSLFPALDRDACDNADMPVSDINTDTVTKDTTFIKASENTSIKSTTPVDKLCLPISDTHKFYSNLYPKAKLPLTKPFDIWSLIYGITHEGYKLPIISSAYLSIRVFMQNDRDKYYASISANNTDNANDPIYQGLIRDYETNYTDYVNLHTQGINSIRAINSRFGNHWRHGGDADLNNPNTVRMMADSIDSRQELAVIIDNMHATRVHLDDLRENLENNYRSTQTTSFLRQRDVVRNLSRFRMYMRDIDLWSLEEVGYRFIHQYLGMFFILVGNLGEDHTSSYISTLGKRKGKDNDDSGGGPSSSSSSSKRRVLS